MRRFVIKLALFVVIIAASCSALYSMPTKYNHDLSIIINKIDLLKRSDSRKIVFVGGSGLLVGLDSRMVKERFKYDVVNLGTFANYGINFLLEETRPYLNPGDIVVICPEYGLIFGDGYFWPVEPHGITWALAFSPGNSFRHIYSKRENFEKLPRDLAEILKDKLYALTSNTFKGRIKAVLGRGRIDHTTIIDEFGDQKIDNFPRLPHDQMEGHGIVFQEKITDSSKFTDLNSFHRFAISRGAKVYFTFSCFPSEEFGQNKKQFDTAYRQLKDNLAFPVLGRPDDFVYPSKYFSNSINHLTQEGKALRTARIVELLANELVKN